MNYKFQYAVMETISGWKVIIIDTHDGSWEVVSDGFATQAAAKRYASKELGVTLD